MCVERARAGALSALAVLALALAGCRSTPTLAAYQPDPDAPAREPRLELQDLELAMEEWMAGLQASPFVESLGLRTPGIAILRIANDSSQPLDEAVASLITAAEASLQGTGQWRVVENASLMADTATAERLSALGDTMDEATAAALFRAHSLAYVIHGRIGDTASEQAGQLHLRDFLFLRVTELPTRRIVYQARIDVTKQPD